MSSLIKNIISSEESEEKDIKEKGKISFKKVENKYPIKKYNVGGSKNKK